MQRNLITYAAYAFTYAGVSFNTPVSRTAVRLIDAAFAFWEKIKRLIIKFICYVVWIN